MIQVVGFVAFVALLATGCGPIPTDSGENEQFRDGIYTNEEWAFRISRPDSTWSLQAAISRVVLENNGLPHVEVWMAGPSISQTSRSVFYLSPKAFGSGYTVDGFLDDLETQLRLSFNGYVAGTKQTILPNNSVVWSFGVASDPRNFMAGTQFWIKAIFKENKAFVMMGNGSTSRFPVDTYEQIASTLAFVD